MKKSLLITALMMSLMAPFTQANAIVPPVYVAPVSAGAVITSSILFSGAVGLGALATWAIATNQTNPLCEIGLNCYSEYPAGANHVAIHQTAYEVAEIPNSQKYPYMDETGMHYPVE